MVFCGFKRAILRRCAVVLCCVPAAWAQVDAQRAAAYFKEAAALTPAQHADARWGYLNAEADALYRQGDEFGDNDALRAAIERQKRLIGLNPREGVPLDWAGTQTNLGKALLRLGERESGTAKLEEAVAAYREALKEGTRERVPLQWAATQIGLGSASLEGTTSGITSTTGKLYLEPGVTVIVPFGLLFVGADANALIIPSVTSSSDGSKTTYTSFTLHGQIGIRR